MFDNALFKFGNYFVFGGKTLGYSTKYQSATFENGKNDVFVMKYLMDKDTTYSCLYESEIDISSKRDKFVK